MMAEQKTTDDTVTTVLNIQTHKTLRNDASLLSFI